MSEQPTTTKSKLVADIQQNWTRLASAVGGLTEAQLTGLPDAEGWTVKDHLLHLAQWERSAIFFLQGRPRHVSLGVDEALFLKGTDTAINAAMFQRTRNLPVSEAFRQLSDTHQQLLALLEPLTDADLEKRYQAYLPGEPGAENKTTAFPVIANNSTDHYVEHLGWIQALVAHPTLIHQRVEAARAGTNPTVICRMASGWAVLADSQFLRGYSILLADPVAPDLNALLPPQRADFLRDMATLGEALLEVTGAYRINYEILGNLDAALHAHVFPRYLTEPETLRRGPAFLYAPAERNAVKFDPERDRKLMQHIAGAVQRRTLGRAEWVKAKRQSTRQRYDTLFAPIYDDDWGVHISPTHERFFKHFLELCPPGALILDAACGTGKYWPLIQASGRTVAGLDQSEGMLGRARAKFPGVRAEHGGLQEMRYAAAFDAACCMDALEFVFPEDWPLVMANLQRALRPGGYLYFTVELADAAEVERVYALGREAGLPVIYGESAHGEGYHYYPEIEHVRIWAREARFRIVEETAGDEYHHVIVQKPA